MITLAKENTIAPPGYNRWRVPPAALAIHLSIGMAYGFSVFWLPLSHAVGVPCADDLGFFGQITSGQCDWKISMLGWMYTLFFVFLGSSAALWGGWLEHAGPRKAGIVSACCWCGGLLISAIGVYHHQLWLLWLGSGVIGGIGLGLGYISPVSTLIKWFPDRRGMATGMAIMGFGGGAMIGAPLADKLMDFFATDGSVGVWQTFVILSIVYFIFMVGGALTYRIPHQGWRPNFKGPEEPALSEVEGLITKRHVHVKDVMKTPQFWMVWGVLCLNVTAGIGIIGMASPLLQEIFGGRLIGVPLSYSDLDQAQRSQIAGIAAGFTGLLSLFNIVGRFFWSSLSDRIGRKSTYFIFLGLGCLLYALIPSFGKSGNLALFVAAFCLILSMYGGGFATIPAYLADLFGTQMVGAIHGRLLTAWATAGVFGPVLVNYIREYQLSAGMPQAEAYNTTMYILAGLLIIGLLCNATIRPVGEKYFMTDEALAAERKAAHEPLNQALATDSTSRRVTASLIFSWLAVGIPLMWGIFITIEKAILLFH